ncbi:putative Plasmid stabilization system protein,RelE/ParE family [Planktothrix serta PCC 8927]|uniref:Plasmid stabilization system protein,RelE/ParE family n=1 Tax=Planktothrix serta PCC 8927 TaxID=671068 RepID=A0A7Z9E2D0_9CYAN|nr:type II toxin-antitoxin system RelE/ParE family toxin [Planktothrix serta]VXD23385.1 putative Plasmid stabilization system protein,RelE/ParE family [Planktothrix serta PCC 8927]
MYDIEFAESVRQHLRSLSPREIAIIIDAIEEQLVYDPLTQTRNRKPLRPNPIAPWELRIGSLRVFYDVIVDESNVVRILAVGKKQGNRLFIGGQEVKLK